MVVNMNDLATALAVPGVPTPLLRSSLHFEVPRQFLVPWIEELYQCLPANIRNDPMSPLDDIAHDHRPGQIWHGAMDTMLPITLFFRFRSVDTLLASLPGL